MFGGGECSLSVKLYGSAKPGAGSCESAVTLAWWHGSASHRWLWTLPAPWYESMLCQRIVRAKTTQVVLHEQPASRNPSSL